MTHRRRGPEPIQDPPRLDWCEVSKVDHYYLFVVQ